jgi:hypothetical protein
MMIIITQEKPVKKPKSSPATPEEMGVKQEEQKKIEQIVSLARLIMFLSK